MINAVPFNTNNFFFIVNATFIIVNLEFPFAVIVKGVYMLLYASMPVPELQDNISSLFKTLSMNLSPGCFMAINNGFQLCKGKNG